MSLRTDIHSAFDTITPSTGGIAERVVETVRRDAPTRERRRRLMIRMRAPLSLVAVVIVVALIAVGLVVGQRLVQRTTTVHNPPPPQGDVIDQAELARLEAIPLALPVMKSTDACVETPFDGVTGRQSSGRVAIQGASAPTQDEWGITYHANIYISKQVTGLVLLRSRDLKTQQAALWGGSYAYGPSGDSVRPQLKTELLVDMGTKPGTGERQLLAQSALKEGHSECQGIQIDGRGFSEQLILKG
ncbi:MAG TPA: hypothetical protein VJQ08_05930 [Candidatus Dormibacteraeota bacterium]|nr:hypothetical protein [Candidatus Dormibacteraeota bacterium]